MIFQVKFQMSSFSGKVKRHRMARPAFPYHENKAKKLLSSSDRAHTLHLASASTLPGGIQVHHSDLLPLPCLTGRESYNWRLCLKVLFHSFPHACDWNYSCLERFAYRWRKQKSSSWGLRGLWGFTHPKNILRHIWGLRLGSSTSSLSVGFLEGNRRGIRRCSNGPWDTVTGLVPKDQSCLRGAHSVPGLGFSGGRKHLELALLLQGPAPVMRPGTWWFF